MCLIVEMVLMCDVWRAIEKTKNKTKNKITIMKTIFYAFIFMLFCILNVSCSSTDTFLEEEIINDESEAQLRASSAFPSYIPRVSCATGEFSWIHRLILTPPAAHNTLRLRVVEVDGVRIHNPETFHWDFCWRHWGNFMVIKGFFAPTRTTTHLCPALGGLHYPGPWWGGNISEPSTCAFLFVNGERRIDITRSYHPAPWRYNEIYLELRMAFPRNVVIAWETYTRRLPQVPPGGHSGQFYVVLACERAWNPGAWNTPHCFIESRWMSQSELVQHQRFPRNCWGCQMPVRVQSYIAHP